MQGDCLHIIVPYLIKEPADKEICLAWFGIFGKPVVQYNKRTQKVHYFIEIREGQANVLLLVLEKLYYAYYDEKIYVEFKKNRFQIEDMILHKMILHHASGYNDLLLMHKIIENNQVTSLDELREIAATPFSRLMQYDEYDHFVNIENEMAYFWYKRGGGFQEELDVGEWEMDHVNECTISNRYINKKMEIKHCGLIEFKCCYIEGDLEISSASRVTIFNCVVSGKIVCTDINALEISESNIFNFVMYNSNITKANIALNKIYRLQMHTCDIDKWDVWGNRFEQSYFANLSLPDNKIDMQQFKDRNVRPGVIKRVHKRPSEKFYLSYQLRELKPKKISTEEIALQTVETLLNNGDFSRNYAKRSDLKYKRILYANRGVKKFYVFLTGGFYKPYRWLIYLVMLTFFFAIVYWKVTDVFVASENGVPVKLDFCNALQYSFSSLVNVDLIEVASKGMGQWATIVQKTLNSVCIAEFFASMIKRYMD